MQSQDHADTDAEPCSDGASTRDAVTPSHRSHCLRLTSCSRILGKSGAGANLVVAEEFEPKHV